MKTVQKYITPKRTALLLFALYFVIGLSIVGDYGKSFDEFIERNTTLANYVYVMERLIIASDHESVRNIIYTTPVLHEYSDRFYGIFLQSFTAIIEHMRNFDMTTREIYLLRHAFTFLNFFVAAVFFYLILKKRFGDTYIPVIGALFFVLNPRIFGESFYNIKDVLFLSWVVISSYFVLCWLENKDRKLFVFSAAFTLAIATNTRILGISILLLAGGFAFMQGVLQIFPQGIKGRADFAPLNNNMKKFAVLGLLTFALFVVITPFLWENPLKNAIDTFFHFLWFQPWDGRHFYLGEMINRDVPWHYIPVWMGVTLPLLYIAMFFVGSAVLLFLGIMFFRQLTAPGRRNKPTLRAVDEAIRDTSQLDVHIYDSFFGTMFFFTLMGYIGLGISMYEGWRHAYGIFPAFMYMAILGLAWLNSVMRKRIQRMVLIGCVAVSLLHSSVWTVINHPFQYVYFNIVGRQFAEENFALDYWGVSMTNLRKEMLRIDDRPHITVANVWFNNHLHMLPPEDQARIEVLGSVWLAPDYMIRCSRIHIYARRMPISGYEKVYAITVNGMEISSLHRYIITPEHFDSAALLQVFNVLSTNNPDYAFHIIDGNPDTWWRTEYSRQGDDFIELHFAEPVSYNLVRLNALHRHEYAVATVSVSMDGVHWYYPTLAFRNAVDNVFAPVEYRYMRIRSDYEGYHAWSIRGIEFGNISPGLFYGVETIPQPAW